MTTHLVDSVQIRTQPPVNAEYAPVHDCTKREVVKDFAAVPPYVRASIFSLTFIVEAVHLRNLTRFVVASDERDAVRVADLVSEQEKECLDGVEATVDKVACRDGGNREYVRQADGRRNDLTRTHEEIVRFWTKPANLEEFHHIPELSMNVTTYLDN